MADLVSPPGATRPAGLASPPGATRPASLAEVLERSFAGRRVLVTGHTGFVGSWLCAALSIAGAELTGLALDPIPGSLAEQMELGGLLADRRGDVRDARLVAGIVSDSEPEIVFHLAAQALVLPSYEDPLGTFSTNVLGTANVLEALRHAGAARACVVVTSDKCYATADRPHREADPLGGDDPYSASKAGAELVAASYASSYFAGGPLGLATARAGNIVGGGDVAGERVLPDCVRAALAGRPVRLRRPEAVRPWQHVLDAIAGYLRLADALLLDPSFATGAWNFGPEPTSSATVGELAALFAACWHEQGGTRLPEAAAVPPPAAMPERATLRLSSAKARAGLGWAPLLDLESCVDWSVEVYRALGGSAVPSRHVRRLVSDQIKRYVAIDGLRVGERASAASPAA